MLPVPAFRASGVEYTEAKRKTGVGNRHRFSALISGICVMAIRAGRGRNQVNLHDVIAEAPSINVFRRLLDTVDFSSFCKT